MAPNIRNRSYTIAAEVEIDSDDASGVLFSQGSRFGGHALYVRDGKLKYVYNFVGELGADRRVRRGDPDAGTSCSLPPSSGKETGCPPRAR